MSFGFRSLRSTLIIAHPEYLELMDCPLSQKIINLAKNNVCLYLHRSRIIFVLPKSEASIIEHVFGVRLINALRQNALWASIARIQCEDRITQSVRDFFNTAVPPIWLRCRLWLAASKNVTAWCAVLTVCSQGYAKLGREGIATSLGHTRACAWFSNSVPKGC
jgi:hypothetical protein